MYFSSFGEVKIPKYLNTWGWFAVLKNYHYPQLFTYYNNFASNKNFSISSSFFNLFSATSVVPCHFPLYTSPKCPAPKGCRISTSLTGLACTLTSSSVEARGVMWCGRSSACSSSDDFLLWCFFLRRNTMRAISKMQHTKAPVGTPIATPRSELFRAGAGGVITFPPPETPTAISDYSQKRNKHSCSAHLPINNRTKGR